MKCCKCNNDIGLNNVLFFPHNKGRLCRKCFEMYDLDIKEIEYRYKVLRGYKKEV